MKEITSLQNPVIKLAASLQQKKYRDESGLFLVEGKAPCMDAITRGWECAHLFVQDAVDVVHENAVMVPREILEKISKKENPQAVIGVFHQRMAATPSQDDFYLALEEIRDPGNLGTIMRTAHAVNKPHIILIGQCCDAFAPEAIRASMGSFSFVELTSMERDAFLAWQQKNNLNMLGTDVLQADDYRQVDYRNAVVVMGNEQKGLSAELKKHCTGRIKIPMPGGTESLNLSVASALVLYQTL